MRTSTQLIDTVSLVPTKWNDNPVRVGWRGLVEFYSDDSELTDWVFFHGVAECIELHQMVSGKWVAVFKMLEPMDKQLPGGYVRVNGDKFSMRTEITKLAISVPEQY